MAGSSVTTVYDGLVRRIKCMSTISVPSVLTSGFDHTPESNQYFISVPLVEFTNTADWFK